MFYGLHVFTHIQQFGHKLHGLQLDSQTTIFNGGIDQKISKNDLGQWVEWVGSIQMDQMFNKSSFIIYTTNSAKSLIGKKLDNVLIAIYLSGPLRFEFGGSFTLSGELIDSTHSPPNNLSFGTRGFSSAYWNSDDLFESIFTKLGELPLQIIVGQIYSALNQVNLSEKIQLYKSMNAFIQAYSIKLLDQRIPLFTQSLEALVCISHREGKREFGKRVSKYLDKNLFPSSILKIFPEGITKALENAYHIRSKLMHGYVFHEIQKSNKDKTLFSPHELVAVEYVLEEAARQYFRFFLDSSRLELTNSRSSLEKAWNTGIL
jgi:hypothetical protein